MNPTAFTWIGKSGLGYQFPLSDIGTVFEDDPGVYVLCQILKDRRVDGIFVGETESLQRTLTNDLVQLLKRHGGGRATHIAALVIHDASVRIKFVADLQGRVGLG